jgi:hypothetical protein
MNVNILIHEVIIDLGSGRFEKANALLADNFRGTILDEDINKTVYISAFRCLLKGFPDLKLNFQGIRADGSRATVKLKMSGTHSRTLAALPDAWDEIPATYKKIDGLIMDLEITFKKNKIEQIKNAKNSNGMFAGLLQHLGQDYKKLRKEPA